MPTPFVLRAGNQKGAGQPTRAAAASGLEEVRANRHANRHPTELSIEPGAILVNPRTGSPCYVTKRIGELVGKEGSFAISTWPLLRLEGM